MSTQSLAEPALHPRVTLPAQGQSARTSLSSIETQPTIALGTQLETPPLPSPVIPFPEPTERRRLRDEETGSKSASSSTSHAAGETRYRGIGKAIDATSIRLALTAGARSCRELRRTEAGRHTGLAAEYIVTDFERHRSGDRSSCNPPSLLRIEGCQNRTP